MRSLYSRIVITFVIIFTLGSTLSLLFVNGYYQNKLRINNEQKILNISKQITDLYEKMPTLDLSIYLTHIASMGFQIYKVNAEFQGEYYGTPFKHQEMETAQIQRVLNGEIYRGILEDRYFLKVIGLFEDSLRNSEGIPVKANGQNYALFIRPDLDQQIGEIRILLAIIMTFTFLFTIVFIVISTRFIVKPIKRLIEATQKIVRGNYQSGLDVSRRDEIGDLARHFAHMSESLRRLDDMRQEFVANVSHEIQSPLTSIQGFAQAILDKEATAAEEERYLKIIEEESRRLSSLSKQLLILASLDKEENIIKRSTFRLDEQIRQVVIATEWQWTEKQIAVELDLAEIMISADRELLYQVWFNLITNSIKFSDMGCTIFIEALGDQEIVVTIKDTGMGIAELELPHIFERFHKADKARNRLSSGSGLGLSICHKIIELHQGTIEVQSQLGRGTTFRITLAP